MHARRETSTGAAPALPRGEFFGFVRRRVELAQACFVDLEDPARAPMPEHTHAEAYLCICVRGTYRSSAQGWNESRGVGVLFHPAGTKHRDHCATPGRCLNVALRSPWLGESFEDVLPERPNASYAPACIGDALRVWHDVVSGGASEADALEERLLLLLSAFAPRLRSRARSTPPWVVRAQRAIADGFEERLRIGALATRLGVHPVVLARGFQRHVGCAPLEYLRGVRVRRATRLLASGGLALAEVAARSGFADQAQFTRAFRRVTGWTPGAWRRVVHG